jgi:hypothetical protein
MNPDSGKVNKPLLIGIIGGGALVYSASMVGLNDAWYTDYPKSSFHVFNDSKEWLQMDKCGHFFASYYESVIGINALRWARVKNNKAIIYGSLWGFILQTPIEILDGYSSNWGFSWADMAGNILGSALAFTEEKIWNEQKGLLKISFLATEYAEKRSDVLGKTIAENIIKDYNAETYWLSFGFSNFNGKRKIFPEWLNLAVGYGADGMLGGFSNDSPFQNYERNRQFYLSFDINTLKIKTKSKFLRILLGAASCLKYPAPALEINTKSRNNIVFHPFYF